MGEELPKAQTAVGKGSFAQTPQMPFLTLLVSSSILKKMEERNLTRTKKVEPSKQDGGFPQLAISSESKIVGTRQHGA